MAVSVKVNRQVSGGALTIGGTETVSCQSVSVVDVPITNATDVAHSIAIDLSQLSVLAIYSDVACTIETNNSTSPTDTITMTAGESKIWVDGDPGDLLSGDVTVVYLTAATAGTLKILTGYSDLTP